MWRTLVEENMKIIEHGNRYVETICMRCMCKYGYTEKDVKTELINHPFSSYFDFTSFVCCPECGERKEV